MRWKKLKLNYVIGALNYAKSYKITTMLSIISANNLNKGEQHGELARPQWKGLSKISFFQTLKLFLLYYLCASFFPHAYHLPLSPIFSFFLCWINLTFTTIVLNLGKGRRRKNTMCNALCSSIHSLAKK